MNDLNEITVINNNSWTVRNIGWNRISKLVYSCNVAFDYAKKLVIEYKSELSIQKLVGLIEERGLCSINYLTNKTFK